jgi:hypothetical protein
MIPSKDLPDPFDDMETPHPLAAESAVGAPIQPLVVRLGDLWTDLMRIDDETIEPDSRPRSYSPMPLLDYMKGIMQWD